MLNKIIGSFRWITSHYNFNFYCFVVLWQKFRNALRNWMYMSFTLLVLFLAEVKKKKKFFADVLKCFLVFVKVLCWAKGLTLVGVHFYGPASEKCENKRLRYRLVIFILVFVATSAGGYLAPVSKKQTKNDWVTFNKNKNASPAGHTFSNLKMKCQILSRDLVLKCETGVRLNVAKSLKTHVLWETTMKGSSHNLN